MSRIRLACSICDCTDYDGIDVVPPDWEGVSEVQSYEDACTEVSPDDMQRDLTAWYTHIGTCPECAEYDRH